MGQYTRAIFQAPNGEILVQVRNTFGKPEGTRPQLQLPGGCVDPGETPSQALIREVYEELGVRLTEDQLQLYRRYDCQETNHEIFFFKVAADAFPLWEHAQSQEPEKFDIVETVPLAEVEDYALALNIRLYHTVSLVVNALMDE